MHRSCDPAPLLPCCPPLAPACLCFGSGSQVPAALPPSFAPDWPACALLCRFPPPLPPQALLSQVRGLSPSTLTCGPPVRHTHTLAFRRPRRQRPSQPHRRRAARPRWLACAPRWPALPLAFALLSPPPPVRPLRLLACLAPCAWAPPPVWPLLPAPVPGRVLPLRLRVALACLAPAPSPGGCALLFPGGAVPHAVEGCV